MDIGNHKYRDKNRIAIRPLIHIGFHKTATSFLQRKIFNDKERGFCTPIDRIYLREIFIQTDPFEFDPGKVRAEYRAYIEKALQDQRVPVLSHEQISGQPGGGGYGLRRREKEASRKEIADRIYDCLPEARILIVIREQRDIIQSIYKFLICGWHGKLSATIEQFLDQSPLDDGYSPLFNMHYIEYHRIIEYYMNLFGRSSVLVLPFEWLRDDPNKFINQIRTFVDLEPSQNFSSEKVNEGYSAALSEFRRVLNRWIVSPNYPGKILRLEKWADRVSSRVNRIIPHSLHRKADKNLSDKIEKLVLGFYAESNQKTARLTGLDLKSLGYNL